MLAAVTLFPLLRRLLHQVSSDSLSFTVSFLPSWRSRRLGNTRAGRPNRRTGEIRGGARLASELKIGKSSVPSGGGTRRLTERRALNGTVVENSEQMPTAVDHSVFFIELNILKYTPTIPRVDRPTAGINEMMLRQAAKIETIEYHFKFHFASVIFRFLFMYLFIFDSLLFAFSTKSTEHSRRVYSRLVFIIVVLIRSSKWQQRRRQ